MNIYRSAIFQQTITDELPPLKKILKKLAGKSIRRIDRFTQLALIGAFSCKNNGKDSRNDSCGYIGNDGFKESGNESHENNGKETHELPARTGLFLSSASSSLENTASVLDELFRQKRFPSPFKFVNTVGNSANFHVSQQLNLQANSIYLAKSNFALESSFKLAQIDIEQGRIDSALIGLIVEAATPIDTHRVIEGLEADAPLIESSVWFLVGADLNEPVLASCPDFADTLSQAALLERVKALITNRGFSVSVVLGSNVSAEEGAVIFQELGIDSESMSASKETRQKGSNSALSLAEFTGGDENGKRIIIDTDKNGRWSFIVINR